MASVDKINMTLVRLPAYCNLLVRIGDELVPCRFALENGVTFESTRRGLQLLESPAACANKVHYLPVNGDPIPRSADDCISLEEYEEKPEIEYWSEHQWRGDYDYDGNPL
jgi:hypothetical protein